MQRLIDADALTNKVDKYIYRITRASKRKLKVGESAILADIKAHIELSPTIDAVPLDGSFLKMSRGDYLIYKRHWLYEHFDMEMDIQRSAMKSMGYEPTLKDTEPRWIPCSKKLPEVREWVLCQCRAGIMDVLRLTADGSWDKGYQHTEYMGGFVVAWMPLPEPYEVEE